VDSRIRRMSNRVKLRLIIGIISCIGLWLEVIQLVWEVLGRSNQVKMMILEVMSVHIDISVGEHARKKRNRRRKVIEDNLYLC